MRYYSDQLKQFFETEEACLAAEETARQEAENKKITKAKLAKNIEDADKNIETAYQGIEAAKKAVLELQKEYDQKVDALMDPALKTLQEAMKQRTDAIKAFNDKFGVYTTTYTGNQALNEFAKIDSMMNKLWKRFYY